MGVKCYVHKPPQKMNILSSIPQQGSYISNNNVNIIPIQDEAIPVENGSLPADQNSSSLQVENVIENESSNPIDESAMSPICEDKGPCPNASENILVNSVVTPPVVKEVRHRVYGVNLRKIIASGKKPSSAEGFTNSIDTTIKLVDGYETMVPVWVEKGKVYRILMRGLNSLMSKSTVYIRDEFYDYPAYNENFPKGAILARIPTSSFFRLINGEKFVSECSGPLYISVNGIKSPQDYVSKHRKIYANMLLSINSELLSFKEIEKRLGWKTKELNQNYKYKLFNDDTQKAVVMEENQSDGRQYIRYNMFLLLNKLRKDPKKFAELYLTHMLNDTNLKGVLKLYALLVNSDSMPLLSNNLFLDKKLVESTKKIINIVNYSDDCIQQICKENGQKNKDEHIFLIDNYDNVIDIFIKYLLSMRSDYTKLVNTILNKEILQCGVCIYVHSDIISIFGIFFK